VFDDANGMDKIQKRPFFFNTRYKMSLCLYGTLLSVNKLIVLSFDFVCFNPELSCLRMTFVTKIYYRLLIESFFFSRGMLLLERSRKKYKLLFEVFSTIERKEIRTNMSILRHWLTFINLIILLCFSSSFYINMTTRYVQPIFFY
jgi:hypothetical protein